MLFFFGGEVLSKFLILPHLTSAGIKTCSAPPHLAYGIEFFCLFVCFWILVIMCVLHYNILNYSLNCLALKIVC